MERVNQYMFYRIGFVLHPLGTVQQGGKLKDIVWELHSARSWLEYLLSGKLLSLVVSRAAAQRLLNAINALIPLSWEDFSSMDDAKVIEWQQAYSITDALQEFEVVFSAELPTFDTYAVSQKGIYSTPDLIERAEFSIDESARNAISADAKSDFRQAGKCLAFELPTACGFHTMRAVESVLRVYWSLVKKPAAGCKSPDMAICINELRDAGEDAKLMDILDHIRDLYRNTIMHPEAFLEMREAQRLFDIAKSAISAMGDRIGELRNSSQTQAAAATAGLLPLASLLPKP